MSRIGKMPIPLPKGVQVTPGDGHMQVKGPKGTLQVPVPKGITVNNSSGTLQIARESDSHAALHGLTRALMFNAVTGVATGFTKELDIVGVTLMLELIICRSLIDLVHRRLLRSLI